MHKNEARRLYLQKRKALSTLEINELSDSINIRFHKFLPNHVKTVHIYLPIQSRNEIDTWPIIHQLWQRKIEVVVPLMHPTEIQMSSLHINKETQIKDNKWNVPEPATHTKAEDQSINAVVIPLLACDRIGNRVGYGKGYYDNFLASIKHKVLKIGLSYFPPIGKITDTNPLDVSLDFCITPDGVIKF